MLFAFLIDILAIVGTADHRMNKRIYTCKVSFWRARFSAKLMTNHKPARPSRALELTPRADPPEGRYLLSIIDLENNPHMTK